MEQHKLRVVVEGPRNSGKTVLANVIRNFLREHGVPVALFPGENREVPSIEGLDKDWYDVVLLTTRVAMERGSAQELVAALKDAKKRLVTISTLLNGEVSPAEMMEAYNTAYSGGISKALEKVRDNQPDVSGPPEVVTEGEQA